MPEYPLHIRLIGYSLPVIALALCVMAVCLVVLTWWLLTSSPEFLEAIEELARAARAAA